MIRPVDARPLTIFYLLALAIAVAVMVASILWMQRDPAVAGLMPSLLEYIEKNQLYTNILSIASFAVGVHPAALLIFVFAAAPTIAAVVVSLSRGGRRDLQLLLDRFRPWRNGVRWQDGLKVYGIVAVVYFGVAGLYLWVASTHGEPGELDRMIEALGGTPITVIFALALGAFIDEGGTLEELGWRGFALPRLIDRMASPLSATMAIGVLWWAWHLPREITTLMGGAPLPGFLIGQTKFLVLCVALSVVITLVFNRTGGSVWAGILIHGGTNVWSKALSGPANRLAGEDVRTIIVVVIAVVILIATGRNLGRAASPD
jgi:hypothetical protein